MIPVAKTTKGSIVAVMADNKRGDQLQRQDSGFLSGSPTPVTPSRHDINGSAGPTYGSSSSIGREPSSCLPTIHERLVCKDSHLEQDSQMSSLSIRPSRPTTLSPHTPPPPVPKEDAASPLLTPGRVIRHYNENGGHLGRQLEEYLEKQANKIVQEVVPETPSDSIEFKALPSSTEPEASSHILPHQEWHCAINRELLCPGMDGWFHEIRDYDRVDNEILGEGGFGVVYACQDRSYQTWFAIKSNKHNSEEKISEMKTECRMLEEIGVHSNITQIFGALVDDYELTAAHYGGRRFKMLMECAINGPLSSLLTDPETDEISGLPLDQSLYYLQQILYAVHYLHQNAILHLDLKCANVLVFNEGRTVKLTDFGSAMRLDRLHCCQLQGRAYTACFSAPEVVRNETVSFSADIWSVLCCLIEMLTGCLPWCYKETLNSHNITMLVGNYDEKKNFEQLLPYQDLGLSSDLVKLFQSVLKRDPKRPSALTLLENPLIKDAHEYEKLFDEYQYEAYEDEATPIEGTPTYETAPSVVKKSSSTESHCSIDSGTYDRSSSSNTSSPGSAGPIIDDSNKTNCSKFPPSMSVIPDSTFRGLESQFSDMSFSSGSSIYRPLSLTSSSAPSDMTGGCWEESGSGGCLFTGRGDDERDGARAVVGRGQLKRTTSANYVSNGPEVDSPDGRNHHRSFPTTTYVKNTIPSSSVFPSNNIFTVSVGTQTSLSPTIESTSLLGSHATVVSSSYR